MPGHHEQGRFVRRENRFVARVERADGQEVRAYLPNTARLHDLLRPGATVVIQPASAPHRRTSWTLTRVWEGTWVALEASGAATLVADHLLSSGSLSAWPEVTEVRREVTVGAHRFDLEVVLSGGERGLVEVKSLSRAHQRAAPLSATPSTRGVSQLTTLADLARTGQRVAVVLVVQRGDVDVLDLTAEADPAWRRAVADARAAGVHVIAYRCTVTATSTLLDRTLPIRDRSPEELAVVYLDSVIEFESASGTATIGARTDGAGPGRLPADLPGTTGRLHVITACNPYSAPLPAPINAERNRRLAEELASRGLRTLPAHGRSPDGAWREPGFAVLDADTAEVLALARRFEQHAVYELTGDHLAVVWTDPFQPTTRRGWQLLRSGHRTSGP